ncbi:MAG: hypothetical protein FJX67_09210 [Alphaproteobacteria bacterium]|nr:hypothetical protein [Alphaproteobacteria bacterium]
MTLRESQLEPGQRFRSQDGQLWDVRNIVRIEGNVPHVSLISVKDPTTTKLISVNALLDQRHFRFVEAKLKA